MQTISNRFTAHVYETHARIALESGDLSEYNQVRTFLHLVHSSTTVSVVQVDRELCITSVSAFLKLRDRVYGWDFVLRFYFFVNTPNTGINVDDFVRCL